MIKAIIFDCDGTLVDSEESHFTSWQRALQLWGAELILEEYLTFMMGQGGHKVGRLLAEKLGQNCAEELLAQKKAHYLEAVHKGLPSIEGTVRFARQLIQDREQHRLKLAVASASPHHEIRTHLQRLGLIDSFDLILSGHEDLTDYSDPEGVNKPKPYIYLHAAKLLGVSPAECAVIEDSRPGVAAGVSAGCITIAVPNAFSQYQDLSHATHRLETLADFTLERFLNFLRNSITISQ